MYQYTDFDQSIVEQRAQEFRSQVERRLAGQLSEDEFKPLRLRNGLYIQLHAYMLRVAIPYGVMSSTQLAALGDIAEKYDRGYGHFTTRQNIQFNWLSLVDTPDILDDLAKVQMHAIQTSGNCIRNITSDPLAGVAKDEWIDPRPLCELLRQWSTDHPEFAYLPRKFKLAITGAANDRALIKAHDIGLQVKTDKEGKVAVDIWVGGGQGRTPRIAELLYADVSLDRLLPTLEAILRVYNLHGRRDNKYKARIKILLGDLGVDAYRAKVSEILESASDETNTGANSSTTDFPLEEELIKITRRFSRESVDESGSELYSSVEGAASVKPLSEAEAQRFEKWCATNVIDHKDEDYRIVVISLKKPGAVPGDMSAEQMHRVADIADLYSKSEVRVTHRQNLILPHVLSDDLQTLWQQLEGCDLGAANYNQPSDVIACPGLDYCSLATARSIPIAKKISKVVHQQEQQNDLSGVSVNISGCINACAHHHVASIGVLGLDRGGKENYQLTLGGRADGNMKVGQRLGPGLDAENVPEAIDKIVGIYRKQRDSEAESFDAVYERIGSEPFREAVYD